MARHLLIGISACFFHPDSNRPLFKGKTLQYVELSILHWLMSRRGDAGAMAVMIPSLNGSTWRGDVTLDDYADRLDGLILHGGADVCPETYGETPLKPEWNGDRIRDVYEIALVEAFRKRQKPVFGICRGLQLLNVALGGTLYQDIATQVTGLRVHRDPVTYDQNFHDVDLLPGSHLASLYPGIGRTRINSVHHQAVKVLAPGMVVEARSEEDGVIEAIRLPGPSYVAAVQWHPEFQDPNDTTLLPTGPILHDFLDAAHLAQQAA